MLNKFISLYTALVLESCDWGSSSLRDLEAAGRSPSHSFSFILYYGPIGDPTKECTKKERRHKSAINFPQNVHLNLYLHHQLHAWFNSV